MPGRSPVDACRSLSPVTRTILGGGRRARHRRHLRGATPAGTVLGMHAFARLLQLAGLAIPPLAIIAQLSESISLGQMLQFLVASVCLFSIGYLLERYSGGGSP